MIQIEGHSANELIVKLSRELLEHGEYSAPRKLETVELEDVFLKLMNPHESIVTLPARDLSMEYLEAEMEWYKNGSYDVSEISKHSKFWNKLTNPDGTTVNSNYGMLIFREPTVNGKSQFDWCADKLTEDISTRQAVLNYNQPKHKYPGNKDFTCTLAQTFRVRTKFYNNKDGFGFSDELEENFLDTRVFMRSNDMIYGLCYDLPWFAHVQTKMAEKVGQQKRSSVFASNYYHYAQSMHVYKKHFQMLEDIASSEW